MTAWPWGWGRRMAAPALLILAMAAAMAMGRYPVSLHEQMRFLAAWLGLTQMPDQEYRLLRTVIIDLRLPRILAACLVGAALSASGAAYQAVFRNPLISPGILGVLAGAAFGAALGLILNLSLALVQMLSFAMGLAAVALGVGIAQLFGRGVLITLILGGIISGGLFTALLSITKYLADPYNQLPVIVYWLMGSLGSAAMDQMAWLAPLVLAGVVGLSLLGRGLDALTLGDDEARALGVPVGVLRHGCIILATLLSASTVSMAGIIGWVGLIIPHIARLLVGPANGALLPASAVLGAVFLLGADSVARTVGRTEIPIGILTELLGIPVFLLVLARARRGWQ